MKFIYHSEFESITNFLTQKKLSIYTIDGKLELFSCDKISSSSSIFNYIPKEPDTFPSVSKQQCVSDILVPRRSRSSTIDESPRRKHRNRGGSLGDLDEVSSQIILLNLIEALNDFFPDYDFHTTRPEQFIFQNVNSCMKDVNAKLSEITELDCLFLHKMWASINEVIYMKDAEIYSYVPDMNDDPFSDGILWSFNYFIFNQEKGKICYFTCIAKR